MPILRNLRNFNNIRVSKAQQVLEELFANYDRGVNYDFTTLDQNDFPEPLTGYAPNFNGTPISSPYWSTREPANAYQDDLFVQQNMTDDTTHSPIDGVNNYTGFRFNEPTVSTAFVLKPSSQFGYWPHRFYAEGSNDGTNYEVISPEYTPQELTTTGPFFALYDINPDKKAFTHYRLRMIGNSYSSSAQYIDALYWY